MEVRFNDKGLERLYFESGSYGGLSQGLARAFRKVVKFIIDAEDERDFRTMRSLNFERLKGSRGSEHSLRLNDQFRLIVEIEQGNPKNTIVIKMITDYH